MSKRGADNYMTDQNWDQEEEAEEAGVFKQANKNTLEKRVIKRASRKVVSGDSTNTDAGSAGTFKGFSGFSGFSKTTDAATAFGNLGSKPLTITNGPATVTGTSKTTLFTASKTNDTAAEKELTDSKESKDLLKTPPLTNGKGETKSSSSAKSKYLNELKTLNEGVTKWIKEHVDKNPYCILSPIFKDYEKYLLDLEKKYPHHSREKDVVSEETDKDTSADDTKDSITPPKSTSKFSFGTSDKSSVEASGGFSVMTTTSTTSSTTKPSVALFSFGNKSLTSNPSPLGVKATTETSSSGTTTTTTSASTGIFGSSSTSNSSSTFSGFGGFGNSGPSVFGSGTSGGSGFSFGAMVKKSDDGATSSAASSVADAEDDYVPPKDEVMAVKEGDSLYTKRCKLFFKRNDQWKEKGVGNLHLKPCGDKTQLLIRADTNLGNILLNIMLSSSLPLSRQGKNNVTLVCVPNPPIDGVDEKTMVPMLIRVKTADDADELLEKLNEHKS